MISLSDPNKKTSPPPVDGFHLHYFPNIPVDEPGVDYGGQSPDSEFKRSLFENLDPEPACAAAPSTSEISAAPSVDQGPSVDEIKESAFQKGFLEGKKVGFESGSKRADATIETLQQTLEQLHRMRSDIHQEIEKEVTHLALSIAKKIVCHEIKTTRQTVACVAREALARVDNPGKIKIKLNPEDLRFIQETQSQFNRFLENFDDVHLEAEDSIQSGGCLIETDWGDIDARIEKQFEAIEEAFQAQVEQPQQELK
jgi:flagellar biosynthesis/type III secretory pathway protein FliH